MKTLENRKKLWKNEGVPTKPLISLLPFIINLKTWYLIKAYVYFLYSIIKYASYLKAGYLISNAFVNTECGIWAICTLYAIAYTSNLQKHGAFLKYCS